MATADKPVEGPTPVPDDSRSFVRVMNLLTFWVSAFLVVVASVGFLAMRPKFAETFRNFQAELPPLTSFCLQIPSEFVIGGGLIWIAVLVVFHWTEINPWAEFTTHAISVVAVLVGVLLVGVAFLMPLSTIATNLNLQQQ